MISENAHGLDTDEEVGPGGMAGSGRTRCSRAVRAGDQGQRLLRCPEKEGAMISNRDKEGKKDREQGTGDKGSTYMLMVVLLALIRSYTAADSLNDTIRTKILTKRDIPGCVVATLKRRHNKY